MGTNLIEARTGNESHSSTWGKFYVHGLDLVAEGYSRDRHEFYRAAAGEIPDGALFTIWHSEGDKRGTDTNDYYICVSDSAAEPLTIEGGCYNRGEGYVRGRFRILAHGDGPVRAPRLLEWVKAAGGIEKMTAELAVHFAAEIKRRGIKTPAPLSA